MPWLWIPQGFLYTSEEPNFINYDNKLDRSNTMWTKDGALGAPGDPSNQSLLIPNAVFYKTAKNLSLRGSDTQKLFLSFILLSTITSFSLFSSLFTKNVYIKLLGILIYLLNFYTVTSIGYTAKTIQMVLLPLLFYLTTKLLQSKKTRYLFYNFIAIYIFQGVFTNLPTAVVSLSAYFFAFIYHLINTKFKDAFHATKNIILVITSITPVLVQQATIYAAVLSEMSNKPKLFAFSAIGAPLHLLLQLRGVWWEKSGHMGIDYFSLWPFYGNIVVSLVTIICLVSVLLISFKSSYEVGKNKSKKIVFWLLFYLLGIGLSSGLYFFPGAYQWLLNHFPPMVMFREPWAKFIPLVIFPLSALTLMVLSHLQKHNKKYFTFVVLLLGLHLSLQSYPFFSGKIIDSEVIGWKRRLVKVPEYWEEYANWTGNNQGAIFTIPFGVTPFNSHYSWYGNEAGNTVLPMPCVFGKSNVLCENQKDSFTEFVKESVGNKDLDFLKLGYIKYVLFQGDIKITDEVDQYTWQATAASQYLKDISAASFGNKLMVYEVKDEFLKPIIYATPEANLAINFTKLNQASYQVKLKNIKEPFVLVFNQAFNTNWQLLEQSTMSESSGKHLVYNNFVNGWEINPKEVCRNPICEANFTIRFKPQKNFQIASDIATIFFKFSLLAILLSFIKDMVKKSE